MGDRYYSLHIHRCVKHAHSLEIHVGCLLKGECITAGNSVPLSTGILRADEPLSRCRFDLFTDVNAVWDAAISPPLFRDDGLTAPAAP